MGKNGIKEDKEWVVNKSFLLTYVFVFIVVFFKV